MDIGTMPSSDIRTNIPTDWLIFIGIFYFLDGCIRLINNWDVWRHQCSLDSIWGKGREPLFTLIYGSGHDVIFSIIAWHRDSVLCLMMVYRRVLSEFEKSDPWRSLGLFGPTSVFIMTEFWLYVHEELGPNIYMATNLHHNPEWNQFRKWSLSHL